MAPAPASSIRDRLDRERAARSGAQRGHCHAARRVRLAL